MDDGASTETAMIMDDVSDLAQVPMFASAGKEYCAASVRWRKSGVPSLCQCSSSMRRWTLSSSSPFKLACATAAYALADEPDSALPAISEPESSVESWAGEVMVIELAEEEDSERSVMQEAEGDEIVKISMVGSETI